VAGRRLLIGCLLACLLAPAPAAANVVLGVGYDEHFALGLGYHDERQESAAPVQLPEAPAAFTAGEVIGGAVMPDGELLWWGGNQFGQAGSGQRSIPSPFPTRIAGGVTQARAGNENGCALTSAGQVLAWGTDEFGQDGQQIPGGGTEQGGIQHATLTPTPVKGLPPGQVVQVECLGPTMYAVYADGSVYGWGNGTNGQLGAPEAPEVLVPRKLALSGVVEVANAGVSHFEDTLLARKADGSVYAMGTNVRGQAGTGKPSADLTTPAAVALSGPAAKVVESNTNGLALLANGNVEAWGAHGGLGYQASERCGGRSVLCSGRPHEVIGGASEIAVGRGTGYALVGTDVVDWGRDELGQLGAPRTSAVLGPATRITGALRISAGGYDLLYESAGSAAPPRLSAHAGPGLAASVSWTGGAGPFTIGLHESPATGREGPEKSHTYGFTPQHSIVVSLPHAGEWEIAVGSKTFARAIVRVDVE
jgi:alpha-tubulin suppressor-like RCC1 family protein